MWSGRTALHASVLDVDASTAGRWVCNLRTTIPDRGSFDSCQTTDALLRILIGNGCNGTEGLLISALHTCKLVCTSSDNEQP